MINTFPNLALWIVAGALLNKTTSVFNRYERGDVE